MNPPDTSPVAVDPADCPPLVDGADRARLLDQVSQAWRQVLDVPHVAEDQPFFEAGGDSILLILLLEQLNELAGDRLEAADLFQHSTIRAQAALIAGDADTAPAEVRGPSDRAALLGRARGGAS